MINKRTKLILLLLTLVLVVAMLGLVACSNNTSDDDDDDDGGGTVKPIEMNFNQYMSKINTGLKGAETFASTENEYAVQSKYTVYTSTENYTLTYKAIYKENKQDGRYYVRIFDNANHVERADIYYDGKDLYVTSGQEHYAVYDFSSLLLFDLFSQAIDILDLGHLFYGSFMQEYFDEGSLLANVFGIDDCSHIKVDARRENVKITNGDLSILMGMFNAYIATFVENIGTSFDAVTNHYLGFRLSKFFEYRFASVFIDYINFALTDTAMTGTSAKASGRMQDNSKYFVEAEYAYDKTTAVIEEGVGVDKKYEYSNMNVGQGMYEGKVTLPTLRDTDFDVSLDYNLNAENNEENEFTFRIYDQRNPGATGLDKYDDINELFSVYYLDETFYFNSTGLYDYVGEGVDLAAFNLPKVYIKDVDLVGLMEIFYTDAIRILKLILDGNYRQESTLNKKTYEAIMSAIKSDVDKQEISVTITEDLIKRIRQDETDVNVLLGQLIGLSEDEVRSFISNDFFELMEIVVTYNFGTGLLTVDVKHNKNTVALFELTGKEYVGLVFPPDLNELNYVEFALADVITIEYDVTMSPYETEDVNLSEFLGIFIGDISGDNIDYHLTPGQSLRIAGKVSEYYVTDGNGEKKATTAVDIKFYNREKKGNENIDTTILTICTNPVNTDEFLIELYIDIGDYDNENGLKYRISRETVSAKLDELVGGESIFTSESNMQVFLSLYQSIEGNAETYISDGYYTVSIMASDEKDPVCEFVGIKNTHAIARMKISFENIDLSTVDADDYSVPYVNSLDDVTVKSIYSSGSAWQEKTAVYVDGQTVNVKLNYTEESTTIITGVNEYHPVASVFGQEVSYAMYVIDQFGTYVIASLEIDNNTLVIDPSLTKKAPTSITVRYDNYETAEVECTIEGFYDNNVTPIGYNLEVLGGVYNEQSKYTLRIGKDSIAERVDEIYVAVINRTVKPLTQTVGDEQKGLYATVNGEQMPVIARITVDPYTYAMTKRDDIEYDVIREQIATNRIRVDFENLYGYETVIDEITKEERQEPLYYNVQGYNWYYLTDLNLSWSYDESLISYYGGKIYAHAYVGDKDNGYATPVAIEVIIEQKQVAYVQINDENPGEYTIDYLIYATYNVPTVSGNGNTVSVVFTDGTSRIVSLSRSSIISTEEYYRTYIYGQLSWAGIDGLASKIDINGTSGLFGTDNNATDTTTASFGGEITIPQTVSLRVVVPSRAQSTDEMKSEYIVVKYDEEGRAIKSMVNLNNAKFNSLDNAYDPLKINPYDATASLPDAIYLYVDKTRGQNSPKEWKQYPITWVTTDTNGEELNIIKKENGKFVLANPVTEEVDLVVYGRVGDAVDRFVWITMRVRNLASNIKDIILYTADGKEFDRTATVVIDPYLSYIDLLPVGYSALLGSGETVDNYDEEGNATGIRWYANIGAEKYPIVREGKFLEGAYDGYYNDDDYLIFSASGGNYGFVMYVSSGSIENEVTIEVSVLVRSIMKLTENVNNEQKFVSHYVDIFDRGVEEGKTYVNENMAQAGYISINYYQLESSLLEERIAELIANDGVGMGGILFAEVGEETVYAKTIVWNKMVLEGIQNALLNPSSVYEFTLSGTVDQGNINEAVITVKVTLYKQTLSQIELTRNEVLLEDKVLSVKNDSDNDGRLSLTELDRVTLSGYYTGTSYDKYFGTNGGYGDNIYDYVAFFNVYKNYAFSISGTKLYVSPYDYFEYVFSGIDLIFESGMTNTAQAKLSLGGVSEEYFNNSVLGLDENTIVEDATGKYSYSYLILEKLSEGSKVERVLVIVFATHSEREFSQITLNEEAFTEDLKELYPSGYDLPGYVEVDYRTTHGDIYTVRYGVEEWLAASGSAPILGSAPFTTIEKEHIDVISGKSYTLMFTIPDVGENFYLIVNFPKKDLQLVNYAATGYISMYDIKDGVITVDNPYLFLKQGEDGKFTFDKTLIPTYIDVYTNNGYYVGGEISAYNVNWSWIENSISFDQDIFTTGGVIRIAQYEFASYYHEGKEKNQYVYLSINLSKMAYSGIEVDGLDVRKNDDTSTNPIYNVITIDPYDESNGYNGRFTLPTSLTVKFNDNSQSYTFTDVKYQLYSTDGTRYIRDISFVDYNEKGHLNMPSAVTDPMSVRLKANAVGLQNVELFVTFIQRIINSVKLDNYVFDDTGEYLYQLGGGGETLFNGTTPIRKTYNSYAEYVFVGPDATINGVMPVYFIDPYNTATYRLPDKVTLDFNSDIGVFGTYDIRGWQLYNEKTNTYEGLSVPTSSTNMGTRIFYSLNSGGRSYAYYNQSASTYQGGRYLMRGYIQVGESAQTFDVLVVVLNRTLRTGVVLDDVYSVSYDFDDPISAMLGDIPCILGEQTFVDYDNYYKDFDIAGSLNNRKGEFTFTVQDKYCFSQKDADGNNGNNAVLPYIIWEKQYDTDGDGVIDLEFDDFTTVGYTGKIEGNVYYYAGNLNALLEYNLLAVNRAYDELVKAQMWDSFFDGDSVAGNFSTTAKNAIEKAKASFDIDKIYITYGLTLDRLNDQYADYLGNDLINVTVQDLNREAITTGKIYAVDKYEDLLVIIKTLYDTLKNEYNLWVEAGSIPAQRTSKIEIFSEWIVVMDEFEKSDVANNSNISRHQQLKAQYYDQLIANTGNFTTEEKNRNEKDFASLKKNLYNYINSDVWQEVYKLSNVREREALDGILHQNTIMGNETLSRSLACDALKAHLEDYEELGISGESAEADVSIPVINYEAITESEGSEVEVNVISFNKINFETIDGSFVVKFKLSYKNVYEEEIEDATDEITDSYREQEAQNSLEEYAQKYLEEVIDAITPTQYNGSTGKYEPISGMVIGTDVFGYDWLKKTVADFGGNGTGESYYSALWLTLYKHTLNTAIYYVDSNVNGFNGYDELESLNYVSPEEWNGIKAVYDILIAEGGENLTYYSQIRVKINQLESKELKYEAVKELCQYIVSIDSNVMRMDNILKAEIDKKYASLSESLLVHSYNYSGSAIGGAMGDYSGDSTEGGIMLGGARMFAVTYDKIDLPGLSEFDLVELLHAMLDAHYYDASTGEYAIEWKMIRDNYTSSSYYDYEGIRCFVALNNANTESVARAYYDYLIGYIASKVSPYDLLCANGYLLPSGISKNYLENVNEGGILAYVTLTDRQINALNAIRNNLYVSYNEAEKQFRRSLVYSAVKSVSETQALTYFNAWEEEALFNVRATYIGRLMEVLKVSGVNSYNKLYAYVNNVDSAEKLAFSTLISEEKEKGESAKREYQEIIDEYNAKVLTEYSVTILNDIYSSYDRYKAGSVSGYTSAAYVYGQLYGKYVANKGYLTVGDNSDDYVESGYAQAQASALKTKYDLNSQEENKVLNSYVKDLTLRAYVRYYDTIATKAQKSVIAEVISMYVGKTVDVSKSLEETVIDYIINNTVTNLGEKIYVDLNNRYDMGKDYTDVIAKAYGYVYLMEMLGGIEYYVYNVLEASGDNTYASPYQEYNKILNALGISGADETVDLISIAVAKDKIWQSVNTVAGGYESSVNNLYQAVLNSAYAYAYDVMYNKQNASGQYLYRDALDEVLEQLVSDRITDEFYQDVFEKVEQNLVEEKLSGVISATEKAVKTVLYDELYLEIKLLDMDKEQFAALIYYYLTGEEGTAEDLLGKNLDGSGGILGGLTLAIETGTLGNSEELIELNEKVTEWWTKSAYGTINTIEQNFLYQIYLQNYYQINDEDVTVAMREELAPISAILSIYLFLGDLNEYIRDNMPGDYFSENNVDEYRYYVMESLYESEVMNAEGHSLTLAKAYLVDRAESYIRDRAGEFDDMVNSNIASECDTSSEYVEFIANALYYNNCAPYGSEENKEKQRALYNKYLDKAKEYVGYVSASSSEEYKAGIEEDNPIFTYVNKIYLKITGYVIGSDTMQGNDKTAEFGLLATRYYFEKAGKDYRLALEEMLEDRTVWEKFYSEDSFDGSNDEEARHVIYFDRTTWEEFVAGNSISAAPGTLDNQNVYFANSLKTDKVYKDEQDTSKGYFYANSFKADDIKFVISDISRINLYFEGEEYANTLSIDAIAPYLPMKARAKGYIDISESNVIELDLGEIDITEYSEAFNALIYKEKVITNDDAYYVFVKALNNTTMKVMINVNYLDRSIAGMYVKSDNYAGDNLLINDASDPFSSYYPIYNDLVNKNVIYMQATNTDILNEAKGEYILPESIGVKYGNGDSAVFNNVKWDDRGISYDIKGTQGRYIDIRIASYEYDDDDGNTRLISYDYDSNVVTMKIYDALNGSLIGEENYHLSSADMIDWRVALYVEDMTIRSISYYQASLGDFVELGQYNEVTQYIDASNSTHVLNPYKAEYPERLRISFMSGANEEITLTQDDWALASNNALINLINVDIKDAVDQGRVLTYFKYLGYHIAVKFETMDIRLPKATVDETGNMQYIEGGKLYLIRNQSSASIQLNEFYSTMYYNFGEGKKANWQKVPLAFDNTDISDVSITQPGLYEDVIGTLGVTRSGMLDKNIVFDIQVIDLYSYASTEDGYNPYVTYDYYSIPRDGNNNRRGEADEPKATSDYFIHREATGDVYFNINEEKTFYDFISGVVEVNITYDMDASVDERLAYDATGARTREITYNVPMKSYLYSSVGEIKFNKSEVGKKWTWTKIPVTNAQYVDAIYWPIGQPMTASDMPTVIDQDSGEEIFLLWDLSEVNVNKASEEGYTVYGSYLTANNTWATKTLIVYIEKIDVTDRIISLINGEDGTYISKTYDATFFKLNFQSDLLEYLREDGTVSALDASEYKIHYMDASDPEGRWRESVYPINVGTYYIRISFEDYNVFLDTGEEWTFSLTIKAHEVDVTKIKFMNQDDETGVSISMTYTGGRQGIVVAPDSLDKDDNGIPSMAIDGWFGTNEKQLLVADYKLKGYSNTEATARAYMDIYNRVNTRVQSMIVGWYDEVKSTGNYVTDSEIKEYVYNVYMEEGMTIEEASVNVSYRYNGVVVPYPTNVGTYSAIVTISDPDGNYVGKGERAISLTIKKNETLVYGFNETLITYNGMAQNPEISDLHSNGAIPEGVTVTYTYVKGEDKLVIINDSNNVSIDQGASSGNFTLRGIKDVGTYNVNVVIDGGNNYINGQFDAIVQIRKASVYITVEEIKALYLDEVKNVYDYVKIYSDDHGDGSADMLRGTDRLTDFGNLFVSTPVESYYPIGEYYTYINGFRLDTGSDLTYTQKGATVSFNEETYVMLTLKGGTSDGSLYKFVDEDGGYVYADIINLFNNYYVYVRSHDYDGDGASSESGKYIITNEEGAVGVDGNEEMAEFIASLKDGDTAIVYAQPIIDGLTGEYAPYEGITLNADVNLTIVGYYDTETAELSTLIKNVTVVKGTLTLKIIKVVISENGASGINVRDKAGIVRVYDSVIETVDGAKNTIGIATTLNYTGRIFADGTTFVANNVGIDLVSGEIEISDCTFDQNYIGMSITSTSNSIRITNSTFNGQNIAIKSDSSTISVLYSTFAYNKVAIEIPIVTNVDMRINNTFTNTNGENFVETNE